MSNVKIKIREGLSTFSQSEKVIATYILENFEIVVNSPIAQLSESSGVSKATWVRFSKTLGFSGLKELKRDMVHDLSKNAEPTQLIDQFDDLESIESIEGARIKVLGNSVKSIEDTFAMMDTRVLEDVRDRVLAASTVRIYGMGASGIVANDFFYKLVRIGINCVYTSDAHINFATVSATDKKDVIILFSHSGLTREILEIAEIASALGGFIIGITKYGKNKLADMCNEVIYTSTPENKKRSGAMGSRIAQLMVVDTLFTIIAKKNFDSIEGKLIESYNIAQKHKEDF